MTDREKVAAMEIANWTPAVQYWRERAGKAEAEVERLRKVIGRAKRKAYAKGRDAAAAQSAPQEVSA